MQQLTEEETKASYEKLVNTIRKHDSLYYTAARPEISDTEYDKLFESLLDFEKAHPEVVTEDSPSQRVGSSLGSTFTKAAHCAPMLSLEKFFEIGDMELKLHCVAETLETTDAKTDALLWLIEPKVDGASLDLCYKHGVLTEALTRGDGETGEIVTANARTIRSIPLFLVGCKTYPEIHIRGEVCIRFKDFLDYNQKQREIGGTIMANPRNGAAGSLRLGSSIEASKRPLWFFPYSLLDPNRKTKTYQEDKLLLKIWGFDVLQDIRCGNLEEVTKAIIQFGTTDRAKLEYPTDGATIKLNYHSHREALGQGTRSPKWSWAYKYAPEQEETKILSITTQVGRTGTLCPVAELAPIEVDGSIISRATLHNWDEIERKDIRVGDHVVIQKAGSIIPEVVSVILSKRVEPSYPFHPPVSCPCCHALVARKVVGEGFGAAWVCSNEACQDQMVGKLLHWCGRDAMDIQDFGYEIARQCVYVTDWKTVADIYARDPSTVRADLTSASGSVKIADTLIHNINQSKQNKLCRVLIGLGIPRVGRTLSRKIARTFKSMEDLLENLDSVNKRIPDFGDVNKAAMLAWFDNKDNVAIVTALAEAGVDMTSGEYSVQTASGSLTGKTFVFTGEIWIEREKASALVEALGGRATGSVSKKTSYVVVGAEAGLNKLSKARSLGIPIIDETAFRMMVAA